MRRKRLSEENRSSCEGGLEKVDVEELKGQLGSQNEKNVDFVLTYYGTLEKEKEKRESFLKQCRRKGLIIEPEKQESSGSNKYYWKIHATFTSLLRKAEEIQLEMPIEVDDSKVSSTYGSFWDRIGLRDPFEAVHFHMKGKFYIKAPFRHDEREKFINSSDEEEFFTSAERSSLVYEILQTVPYGDEGDDAGLHNLLHDKVFTDAFPLHEDVYKLREGQKTEDMSIRQYLYYNWCHWKCWLKWQPLNEIRTYFGVKVAFYFKWLEFYTLWLIPAALLGMIIMTWGFLSSDDSIESVICDPLHRYEFYSCPDCDTYCDFKYLTDSCSSVKLSWMFNNGGSWFFAIFISFWAVLFLEFWKRQQSVMQYEWNVLGYEDNEEIARPQFVTKIKQLMSVCSSEKAKDKYCKFNSALNKREYTQPWDEYYSKIAGSTAVLITMLMVSVASAISVAIYQQEVSSSISKALNINSVDIVLSFSGAIFQFVAATLLSKLYTHLAMRLNDWELHRTQSDYESNLTAKLFAFEFVNYYSPLFYIAFIKGNFVGFPGSYIRIGEQLRFTECGYNDCLWDLTVYLFVFMIGRIIVGNIGEIGPMYFEKTWFNVQKETDDHHKSQLEADMDLAPVGEQNLFYEYLELVVQYGLVTIFVAALPIVPLLALLNNIVEIRVDANKFLVLQRRVVAERADSIGSWCTILEVISKIAVVVNAFYIGFSTDLVPWVLYQHGLSSTSNILPHDGYFNWSYQSFPVSKLLDGHAFPALSNQHLPLYNGSEIIQEDGKNFLYLPYVDFECLNEQLKSPLPVKTFYNIIGLTELQKNGVEFVTIREDLYEDLVVNDDDVRNLVFANSSKTESPQNGKCFHGSTQCRYPTFAHGETTTAGDTYWKVMLARLAFAIIFEHFVFTVTAVIAFVVPDVPQRIKDIKRQKQTIISKAATTSANIEVDSLNVTESNQ